MARPGEAILRRLADAARTWPEARLATGDATFDLGRLVETIEAESGVAGTGERVLILPTRPGDALALFYAAMAGGGVPLLGDPTWTGADLAAVAGRTGAELALVADGTPAPDGEGWRPDGSFRSYRRYRRVPPAGGGPALDEGCAFLRFTSGATGRPRALQFTAEAALAAADHFAAVAGYGPETTVLCFATLNNGLAFNTCLLSVLSTGGTVTFHGGEILPGAAIEAIARAKPDTLVAFPFLYDMLVRRPEKLRAAGGRLRLALSAAAALPPRVAGAWRSALGFGIADYYGVAEAGPITFNAAPDGVGVGRPIPGCRVRILDGAGKDLPAGQEGRIAVRTPYMAIGYLEDGQPDLSEDILGDGSYRTKDLGHLDAEGRLVLTGRAGPVVIIGGRKVDPREVEAAIAAVEGVGQAVVLAEGDSFEPVLAAHVETGTLTAEALRRTLADRLPGHAIPTRIHIHAQLPRSASGKVRADALRRP